MSRRRKLLALLILAGLALWLLLPQIEDVPKLAARLRRVALPPLLLALAFQAPRYLAGGFLMSLCARHLPEPFSGLLGSQVTLASGAAARLLPVGGAGGVAVRYAFLKKRGMDEPGIAAYFLLQNLLGAIVIVALFLASALYQSAHQSSTTVAAHAVLPTAMAVLAGGSALVGLIRRPEQALKLSHRVGTALDALTTRLFARTWRFAKRLPGAVQSLRQALVLGGGTASGFLKGLGYAFWTVAGDVASLHTVAVALSVPTSLATSVVVYSLGSFAGSAAAMPAGLGVTEGAMAAVYLASGYSADSALSTVLLFRALSFWLPIPLGAIAAWRLRTRQMI